MNEPKVFYLEGYRYNSREFQTHLLWDTYEELLNAIEYTKRTGGTTICYFKIKLKNPKK
jgi:hypothetical protein